MFVNKDKFIWLLGMGLNGFGGCVGFCGWNGWEGNVEDCCGNIFCWLGWKIWLCVVKSIGKVLFELESEFF